MDDSGYPMKKILYIVNFTCNIYHFFVIKIIDE